MAAPGQGDKPKGIEFYGGYQVYSESGVDLTQLRENLRLSVEKRLEDSRRAQAFALVLREAGMRARGEVVPENEREVLTDALATLKLLLEHRVQFVLVGCQAMQALGSAYVTKDLDICYHPSPDNLVALAAALSPIHPWLRGAPPGCPSRLDVPTLQAGREFALRTDCGDLDLLGEVCGIGGYEQVFNQSEELHLFGSPLRVLSVDGLIAAKKAAGRRKDVLHLLELEELKKMREAPPEDPNRKGAP